MLQGPSNNRKSSLLPWAIGAGGIIVLLAIIKYRKQLRPFLVMGMKKSYAVKEWTLTEFEKAREDFSDMWAEAVHHYEKEKGLVTTQATTMTSENETTVN
ncbi:MAG: hypothetical protein HYV97_18210 [Bdellovibrio sp.]|nr:hypothetical protein [Bdellovibrio sp.]